jgi:inorganic pyrophosphatase
VLKSPLVLGTAFPFDFGFVPGTKAEDGDPVDAMVLLDAPTAPGVVVACRPIGVVRISQEEDGERERNDRIIAVATEDERRASMKSPKDLSARERKEIEQFFVAAAALEGKKLAILGWGDAREATRLVEKNRSKKRKAA